MPQDETVELNEFERPLYAQLTRVLRRRIRSGEFGPGEQLPSEQAMCQTFGVSRITVREALRILTDEGLIERHSGRGTFVSPQARVPWSFMATCTMKDLLPTGETHRKIVARRIIRASGKAAEKLEVPAGTRLLEIEAVMHIKETALGYITLNLPYDTGRRVPPNRLKEGPLILLLADICNIQVARVDQWTTAELADTALSDALDIAVGSPILVIERVLYDPSNRPIQWALNRFPPERFGHYIRFQQPVSEVARRRRLINVPARSAL